MMQIFDTHAHFEGSADETSAALSRAAEAGVARVMAVGGSESLNAGVELAAACAPGGCQVLRCLGWDRDQVGKELPDIDYSGAAAVGEIGLDYHYAPETRDAQRRLFSAQLELSCSLDLPAVIHTREADDDTLGILREIPARGIIHCFTGSVPFCRALLDLGWYISYSGIVTFRAAENVRESARYVPDDRILVETDSPFLAPVPLRGTVNEPANIVHTVRFLADLRGKPVADFALDAWNNSSSVLGG